MSFISIRNVKFYTKETIKFLNIVLLAFGIIIAIILIKYKPMYEVKISGKVVGYVKDKNSFNYIIKNNIENYKNKNIDKVVLTENPEYELKLVEKTKENDESEILIAIQKELEITYRYFEIALNEEIIEEVESLEIAEQIVDNIKEKTQEEVILNINEKTTENIKDMNINSLEVAEANIIERLDIDITEPLSNVNGVKISTLPVTGVVSSRYGVSSSVRSSKHTGLDIAAKSGTQIKAIANGKVTFASESGAYGYLIKINHGNGVESWYAHTSKMYVKSGEYVKAGDIIALVGSTGNSTGPHLHLEVRVGGKHVNPQQYLYNN